MSSRFLSIKLALLLLFVGVILVAPGFRCKCIKSAEEKQAATPLTLTYWGVWHSPQDLQDIIALYKAKHPNITIQYKKLRMEEYEEALLQAWADDQGPDIFSVPNTWVVRYQNRMTPMPNKIVMLYEVQQKALGIKNETVTELRQTPIPSLAELRAKYVDVVSGDVIRDTKVWGLPYAVDTLSLYYNRQLMNSANIPQPPGNWEEFVAMVQQLTFVNKDNAILQAGAAIGTGSNIERSSDILSLLMLQNGSSIVSGNTVTFASGGKDRGGELTSPGLQAIAFYTDFANPLKAVYTWNGDMPVSFEAFVGEKAAFFFGYAYHMPLIRARAPKLDFGVVPVPQVSEQRPVNIANYWVEAVPHRSAHPQEAWDFILFATDIKQASVYSKKTGKPSGLRALIDGQKNDEVLRPFSSSVLTAQSWYKGKGAVQMEEVMAELLDTVVAQSQHIEEGKTVADIIPKLAADAAAKIGATW